MIELESLGLDNINKAVLIEHFNNAQDEFCRITQCLSSIDVQNIVANQKNYDLPANFISEDYVLYKSTSTSDGLKLTFKPTSWVKEYENSVSGVNYYTRHGKRRITLCATPSSAVAGGLVIGCRVMPWFKIDSLESPVVMDEDNSEYADAIVNRALWKYLIRFPEYKAQWMEYKEAYYIMLDEAKDEVRGRHRRGAITIRKDRT